MPIEQDATFTIHSLLDIHGTIPYKSPVFRTNYYSFVFIKDGRGNYTTDELTFEYGPRTIYFTNPGHLKAFEFYELRDAYLVTLSEQFLKENVHADVFRDFPFLLAETVAPQSLSPREFEEVETLYLQLLREYQNGSAYKYRIIGNLFVVLLLKIKEAFWGDYRPLEEGDRSSQIVRQFREELERHYTDLAEGKVENQFQVQDYAAAQHLHPNYFSQVISSKTGQPVTHWIAEKTIAQANALLRHSTAPIKEVARKLGFRETSHFSNYYRKHAGLTPSAFRRRGR
jgi:AraC-like DNA-binding protein